MILRFAILAVAPGLMSCCPSGFVMYRGTDIHDGYDDISVIGDRAHDVVRLRSAWCRFEIPLPYAEDWAVYDSGKGTISADSTALRMMVSVFRTNYPLRRDDPEQELSETQLRAVQAVSPKGIDQVTFRKRDAQTLLEYVSKGTSARWFAVCGKRSLEEPAWNYLIKIQVQERPEPRLSKLLERARDIIAREFRTLP